LMVVGIAVVFNLLNSCINARWISHLGRYDDAWLMSVPMIVGVTVFVVGMAINLHADTYLASLRTRSQGGYVLPKGGLFEYVVQPNYLGELLEWIGWAIATWSWAGAAFAAYTFANLAPRARDNRSWYQSRFEDFPARRRAMIPWLW
ncbi:MAG: 3-oxo-5-alpha-steroid 4-dehydrogenase, partial [Nannocystaceae bacterium]